MAQQSLKVALSTLGMPSELPLGRTEDNGRQGRAWSWKTALFTLQEVLKVGQGIWGQLCRSLWMGQLL